MIKVAIIDDYQNVAEHFVNSSKSEDKYEITIFNEPFANEDEAIEALKDFDALMIMRERTPITKSLISELGKLKFDKVQKWGKKYFRSQKALVADIENLTIAVRKIK